MGFGRRGFLRLVVAAAAALVTRRLLRAPATENPPPARDWREARHWRKI